MMNTHTSSCSRRLFPQVSARWQVVRRLFGVRVRRRRADWAGFEHGRGHDPIGWCQCLRHRTRMASIRQDGPTRQIRTEGSLYKRATADVQEERVHERVGDLQCGTFEPNCYQDDQTRYAARFR